MYASWEARLIRAVAATSADPQLPCDAVVFLAA